MITKEIELQLNTERQSITEQANAIAIKTEADNLNAVALLTAIKGIQKKVNATFKPMLDSAKATLNAIKTEHKKFADPLDEAEDSLRQRMGQFMLAENKRREALQAKADAKFAKAEAKAELTGKPLTVAPTIVAKVESAPNTSISKRYYAEVTDIKALALAVINGELTEDYILPNQVLLNRTAIALKENFSIPGAVAKFEMSTTIRGI
jgi:hypothetical protein